MNLSNELLEYLKKKIPDYTKTTKKGHILFTCPNIEQHKYKAKDPTATFIPGSDKINCLQCGWKGTAFDSIRVVERNADLTDAQILESLNKTNNVKLMPELDFYVTKHWSLVPIANNGKAPIEKAWTEKTHFDKSEWVQWLTSGLNIGCRTGKISGITVVDVDLKIAPTPELEAVYKQLTEIKTLESNTPHGRHFIFQYDEDIKTGTQLGGMTVDIRNDGGQILIHPSKINNLSYCWKDENAEIKKIPDVLKAQLLDSSKSTKKTTEFPPDATPEQKGEVTVLGEGSRNDTLLSLGGILVKQLNPQHVEFVLNIINNNFVQPKLPAFEIKAMLGSLTGYRESEEETQERTIYDACKLIQADISAKDIMEHTGLKRAIVDKYLAQFHKEGQLSRRGRGRYDLRQKVEWINEIDENLDLYNYHIPYFSEAAHFQQGDIILLGGKSGTGKTHIAMNIIKKMREQGVVPFYISLESGSRYKKIANLLHLDLKQDFYVAKEAISNPLQIEIEPNSFTIIDWLYTGEDFAATQSIFKHLSDEMRRKGGVLVVFTQLKDNYDYFAVNLIKSFPSFAARYIYDDETGVSGHWQVDKIRDAKGHYQTTIIPCEFDFDTKELRKKNII